MIEFALIMPALFALIFVQIDLAFDIFIKATLLQAARTGVRYGVTNRVDSTVCPSGAQSLTTCVKEKVREAAGTLLSGGNGQINVIFKALDSSGNLNDVTSSGHANQGGNIMEVQVTGYSVPPLLPLIYFQTHAPVDKTPLTISVAAADRIEPTTTPPSQ
jgi:Flp pilus assembly protein TadG